MTVSPVVIVTGASRGIGAAITRWLVQSGARVFAVARTPLPAADRLQSLQADVASPAACAQIVAMAVAAFGRIDALVNNAGGLAPLARIADAAVAEWRLNLEVNLLGPFYLIRHGIPHLRRTAGRIVNISSGADSKAIEGWSAYCVAKAGLTHLTRLLAAEEPDLTAVALRPGVVDTAMQAAIRRDGPGTMTTERVAYFQGLKDHGELLDPEVPGRIAAWLALHAPRAWSGELIAWDDPRLP